MVDGKALWRSLCHLQFILLLVIYTFLSLSPAPGESIPLYNDKLMHFSGYLVAGLSISFAWPLSQWWHKALFLLAYSTAIEVIQHFLPTRSFSYMDMLANTSGIALGLAVFVVFKTAAPRWLTKRL